MQPTREPLNPAGDFTNRLTKKQRQLASWAKQEEIDSYRLYDADLPDYNVAIDRYADYRAPRGHTKGIILSVCRAA